MANQHPDVRHLIVVFGDQLDPQATAFEDFDPDRDAVWMGEAEEESTHVWSHKQRIALFLAAMRHFRERLRQDGIRVFYRELDQSPNATSLFDQLDACLRETLPEKVIATQPGEWRVLDNLKTCCRKRKIPCEIREDRYFLVTLDEFRAHAKGRKSLRMEFFYREARRKHNVLMNRDGTPAGGQWNYDADNRETFGRHGPESVPSFDGFKPDKLTRAVLDLVNKRFADHPGSLESFAWPVTPEEAKLALDDFVENRLASFGRFQDAMWTGEPWLYHSRLSTALNLKLLDPRDVTKAAEEAWSKKRVPLASAEGFIRQILGWREYVRGIYWLNMPGYENRNELGANGKLPGFYWTGETEWTCLRETIGQTLRHGYAHHIQRLMVTGLFGLLAGIDPSEVHRWYLAVYVDAVEWVELPNTLGMSQYADGGLMASKPYAATGKYIQRMSNYCGNCPKNPANATGEDACPFTTLYWDFLDRHRKTLEQNPRMKLQVRNLDRRSHKDLAVIRKQARDLRQRLTIAE